MPLESLAMEPGAALRTQIHRFRTKNEATTTGICKASVLNELHFDDNMIKFKIGRSPP